MSKDNHIIVFVDFFISDKRHREEKKKRKSTATDERLIRIFIGFYLLATIETNEVP